MTYKWLYHTHTIKTLSQVTPQILQWFPVDPFISCHPSPYSFYFLSLSSHHPHQFPDSYRDWWRSELVCLIVCHENGISVDGWRDSRGEMQSQGKQHRKGWIVIITDFFSPGWGSMDDGFTLPFLLVWVFIWTSSYPSYTYNHTLCLPYEVFSNLSLIRQHNNPEVHRGKLIQKNCVC